MKIMDQPRYDAGTFGDLAALARIREHLEEMGVQALVEMIVDLAERDPALFNRLNRAVAAVHADDKTLALRLRKAMTQRRARGDTLNTRKRRVGGRCGFGDRQRR